MILICMDKLNCKYQKNIKKPIPNSSQHQYDIKNNNMLKMYASKKKKIIQNGNWKRNVNDMTSKNCLNITCIFNVIQGEGF